MRSTVVYLASLLLAAIVYDRRRSLHTGPGPRDDFEPRDRVRSGPGSSSPRRSKSFRRSCPRRASSSTIPKRSGIRNCKRPATRLKKAEVEPSQIAAIGVTNQRETTILWDRATGKPVANAIVWQSRVSAPICERLKADGLEPLFRERTGLRRRCLFFRHEDQAPARYRPRPARAGRARRDSVRHGRYVSHLATHAAASGM